MSLLRARLYDIELEKHNNEQYTLRKDQIGTGSRSEKIRTYNYKDSRCTDHRLNQNFVLSSVLLGELSSIHEKCCAQDQETALRSLTGTATATATTTVGRTGGGAQ